MKRFHIITAIFAGVLLLLLVIPFTASFRLPLLIILLSAYLLLLVYGASRIDSRFFVQALCRGESGSGKVAITFDDGPDDQHSSEILEILKKHDSPASFFLTGKKAESFPGIVAGMAEKGHLIGNHSYSHSNIFPLFTGSGIRKEIERCNRVLENAGAGKVRFFRPPFGVSNPNIARGLKGSGMWVAGWSIRSFDTRNEAAEKVVRRIVSKLGGGDVILLHETSANIMEILELLLPAIAKAGLSCVTLDRLPGYLPDKH